MIGGFAYYENITPYLCEDCRCSLCPVRGRILCRSYLRFVRSVARSFSVVRTIRQALQINPFFDRNFFVNLGKTGKRDIYKAMEAAVEADRELKSSSRPPEMVLEELILSRRQAVPQGTD